jgi:hypothetical protein
LGDFAASAELAAEAAKLPARFAAGDVRSGPDAAETWPVLSRLLAATPWARRSPDGGDNFPDGKRHRVRVGGDMPSEPATVSIYGPAPDGATVGRLLVADFDVGRARADAAADPVALVAEQADACAGLLESCGLRVVHDVSPSGGRHVYARLARPVPWEELRDVVLALADRYSTLDPAPMRSPSGQIRIAGSPYKRTPVEQPDGTFRRTGRLLGYLALSMPLADAVAALRRPAGPQALARLRQALAAELAAVDPAPTLTAPLPGIQHLDAGGRPWAPLRGGRRPLGPRLAELARTGAWDALHLQPEAGPYPSPSEARYAVLRSLAAGGWTYGEAVEEMRPGGPLAGLASALCGTRSPAQRRAVLTSDWDRAALETITSRTPHPGAHNSHTSLATHPPRSPELVPVSATTAQPLVAESWTLPRTLAAAPAPSARVHQELSRWLSAVAAAERSPVRCKGWGRRHLSVRLVLRALATAARHTGDTTVAWGTRSLALACGLSWRTVADVLADLRDEPDPLIDVVERGRDGDPDVYALRVPDAYRADAARQHPMAGRIETGHPVWLAAELGPVAALLYEALSAVEARPVDLERRAALSSGAVAVGLADLGAYGLAERGRDGWRRGPRTLDDAATELQAWDAHRDRVEQYRAHRADLQAFLASVEPMRAAFETIVAAHEQSEALVDERDVADPDRDTFYVAPTPAAPGSAATAATQARAAEPAPVPEPAPAGAPSSPTATPTPLVPAPRPAPPPGPTVRPDDEHQDDAEVEVEDVDAGTPVPPPVGAVVAVRHGQEHADAAARGAALVREALANRKQARKQARK